MLPEDILTRMLGHDWRTTFTDGTQMAQQNAKRGVVENLPSSDKEAPRPTAKQITWA